MEILTDEQREITKLEIQLDVCKRDKDALLYQLSEAKRKAAEHKMHPTAFGAFLAGGFVGGLLMLIVLVGLYGGG